MARKSLVLVIHRNDRVREEISERLLSANYHVCGAYGKHDGIAMLYQMHPDVVLLEFAQSSDESWDTLARIRMVTQIPIIFLAEDEESTDWKRGNTPGATGFVDATCVEHVLDRVHECPSAGAMHLEAPGNDSFATRNRRNGSSRALCSISDSELRQVDRALADVGERGEVRLIKLKGRLCFIARVKTRPYENVPA